MSSPTTVVHRTYQERPHLTRGKHRRLTRQCARSSLRSRLSGSELARDYLTAFKERC